jgi:hypothetical protein
VCAKIVAAAGVSSPHTVFARWRAEPPSPPKQGAGGGDQGSYNLYFNVKLQHLTITINPYG